MRQCLVQVLSPIVVNGKIVTSGEVTLPEDEAVEHDRAGRGAILSRDGVLEQWPGCCDRPEHSHGG